MGGFLTGRQCSMCTENLKDHSFWDFFRTWVRKYFWLIPVIVIVLTLLIIYCSRVPPELDCKCPKDQAKLLHNISQLEAENLSLRKQLAKMEKEMQKLKSVIGQTGKKTSQLLAKKQEEADALSKELSVSNQSLVLTRQLLEKEKKKAQSLQSQLENAQKELRDSCQKHLNTLEEKLKSSDSKAEEYKDKIAKLQLQMEEEQRNRDRFTKERTGELNDQIAWPQQKESSTQNILEDYGSIAIWAFVILGLLICCVQCCSKEW
ncbi:stress response protein NST1-like isoform X1 [Crotalus tigris]|uniref:stress response protein NST1-like isoform X1 n=1 Tax=Crotalus tigris TaxID=88082 RepID=UPI00192F2281|nr:stress response protein NST1-like isoform X1 [Crotalus tigris]